MTDKQMETMLKMIIEIMEGYETFEEAKEKIKALLKQQS